MNPLIAHPDFRQYICRLRGRHVMLDRDLAELYQIEARVLNQAVKRHGERFPPDFMFQLTREETDSLRSQNVILKRGGHSKYRPYAFTEQGVSMLSSVLHSKIAIAININIMRAFVSLRHFLLENEALRYAVEGLEKRMGRNERNIQIALDAIRQILEPPAPAGKERKMGFAQE